MQPQLYNEVFDDDLEGLGGADEAPPPKASSPRKDYMSLAAVPRFSRPSMELQVPTGAAGGAVGVFAPGDGKPPDVTLLRTT